MIDSFLKKVFAFSRLISALVSLVCILTMIGGVAYYVWAGPDGLEAPDFNRAIEEAEQKKNSKSSNEQEAESLAEQREMEKKYGDDLEELVKLHGLDKDFYESRIERLIEIDEDFRSEYVKGLKKFMKRGHAYLKEKGESAGFVITNLTPAYDARFNKAIKDAEASKVASKAKRMTTLSVIGGALCLMIMFLFIPLLIKIEINTRGHATSAAPATPPSNPNA